MSYNDDWLAPCDGVDERGGGAGGGGGISYNDDWLAPCLVILLFLGAWKLIELAILVDGVDERGGGAGGGAGCRELLSGRKER